MSKVVFSRNEIAGFTAGDTASSITDDFWTTQASNDTQDVTETEDKIYTKMTKRYGEANLVIDGRFDLNLVSSPGPNSEGRVIIDVGGQVSNTYSQSVEDTQDFSLSVDISSLINDTPYTVTITVESFLDQNNAGTIQIVESRLYEDITIYTTT
jgi:hypothetical protein